MPPQPDPHALAKKRQTEEPQGPMNTAAQISGQSNTRAVVEVYRDNTAKTSGEASFIRHFISVLSAERNVADTERPAKKLRFDDAPVVQQHVTSTSKPNAPRDVNHPRNKLVARDQSVQDTDIIDLTHDLDQDGSLPQDCVKKLLGFARVNGKIDTSLDDSDIRAIAVRLKELFDDKAVHIFHPSWASTERADHPNKRFGRRRYDKFILVLNIDNQMRTVLLVKSSKCAFYFDSISKGSVQQEFQERIQFIISINQEALGRNWQHLHTDTHHQHFEEHCFLLPLLNIECILRGISLPDVSPSVQTLRYRYEKKLLAAHPNLASELDPLLKRYLSVERSSINLEAFERDIAWRKAAKQSVGESRIKDEFEDDEDEDEDDTPR